MKRTTIVLTAAALGGLSAFAFAGGTQEAPTTGWPLILGYQPTNLRDAAPGPQKATSPRGVLSSQGLCNGLNDNGVYNQDNGYSNATHDAFMERRTLLDDFEVPNGEIWTIDEIHHTHVWGTLDPGTGVAMEMAIWTDSAGVPEAVLVETMVSTGYTEVATGMTYFDRPEAATWAAFDPIVLDAGRYWFEATIVGPENNFWLTADVIDSECWTNYENAIPTLRSGTENFGSASDLNWCLTGSLETGGPANQFGMKQSPVGAATLAVGAGTLTVENIGSSGEDGVSADLGNSAGGWVGHSAAPAAGTMGLTAVGIVDGVPDTRADTMLISLGATSSVTMEAAADGSTFTRNLYLDGEITHTFNNIPYGVPAAQTNDSIVGGNCLAIRQSDRVAYSIVLDSPVNVSGGFGMADEIELVPDAPLGASVDALTDAEVTAADTGDITLDDEGIVMFGNENRRVGVARIAAVDGTLRVSNLGSSGQDGVSIDLDNVDSVDTTLDPIVANITPDKFNQTATGCFNDTEGSDLGRSSIINGSGFTVLQGDFAAISASNMVLVELYDDGALVASIVRPGGGNTMIVFADGTEPFPNLLETGVDTGPTFSWNFDANLDLRTGTQPATSIGIGDEIRVSADDPDAPVTAVDSYDLATSIGPALVITAVTVTGGGNACGGGGDPTGACCIAAECSVVTEADCLAGGGEYLGNDVACDPGVCDVACDPNGDANGDGCVSFQDILDVLGNWANEGEPGILGDSDCNGVVNFNDILNILGTFISEACSP